MLPTQTTAEPKWTGAIASLVKVFVSAKPGDVIGYNTLSELCGETVTASSYPVRAALNKALRMGASFTCVPLTGYRRNNDHGGLRAAQSKVAEGRRKLIKGERHLSSVDPAALKGEEQRMYHFTDFKISAGLNASRKRKLPVSDRRTGLLDEVMADFRKSRGS